MKAHPTFHVSSLKRYNLPEDGRAFERPEPEIINGEEEYEVEELVDNINIRKRKEYLVKWKGFIHGENEWLSSSALKHAKQAIADYHSRKNDLISTVLYTRHATWHIP